MTNDATVWLIYDGDCPICSPCAKAIKIKHAIGNLVLINAREPQPIVDEIKKQGLDLNEGFVVKTAHHYYHGADAMHFLALVSTESDGFNRLNAFLFKHKFIAELTYPLFRGVRNILLRLKRIPKIPGA